MGYDITQTESQFTIVGSLQHGLRRVLETISQVHPENLFGFFNGHLWNTTCEMYHALDWCSNPLVAFPGLRPLDNERIVQDLLHGLFRANRWDIGFGYNRDGVSMISGINFAGYKLGGEASLLRHIAPLVEAGSNIGFRGEDGKEWRLVFERSVEVCATPSHRRVEQVELFVQVPDPSRPTGWRYIPGLSNLWDRDEVSRYTDSSR